MEIVEGQSIDFERDFIHFGMWQKPKFFVRFHPVVMDG